MIKLVETCGGCPEAYDAYDADGKNVGYLRLRHGYFRVECMGQTVYEAHPNGDGIFEYEEREFYLTMACTAIENFLSRMPEKNYEIVNEADIYS
jgi:hypothetical protein